ncbi:MAG: FtsH protease activity modulator HflK [Gammaproteobacteria bacterium]|nr:FtsH protease activity modulator HflK [Gammaproteobacteria bacterium]
MKFSDYDPWSKPGQKPDTSSGRGSNNNGSNGRGPNDKDDKNSGKDNDPDSRSFDKRQTVTNSPLVEALRFVVDTLTDMLGGKGSKGSKGSRPKKGGMFYSSGVILAVAAIVWGVLGIYMVDEQERGVVLRFGKYYSIITPGLKWQPYFIDKVIVLNVTQVRSFSSRGTMLTKDENIVDITVNVQYLIDDPQAFAINTKDPELSLRQAADSSLRHVVGGTVMDQVITEGRAQVAADVQERLQLYVNNYGTGIGVSQISIQRADPPEQVKASFEDVISAREDKVRFNNQAVAYSNAIIPQARGEARRILEDAEGYKRDKIARAEGQAQRFDLVYDEYRKAPAITKTRLYIEAMEDVLANSNKILIDAGEGSNNLLYLPLDRIIKQADASRGDTQNFGEAANANANSGNNRGASPPSNSAVNNIVNKVLEELRKQSPRTR